MWEGELNDYQQKCKEKAWDYSCWRDETRGGGEEWERSLLPTSQLLQKRKLVSVVGLLQMFAVGQGWERAGTVSACQFEGDEEKSRRPPAREAPKAPRSRSIARCGRRGLDRWTAELHALCGARFAGEFQAN